MMAAAATANGAESAYRARACIPHDARERGVRRRRGAAGDDPGVARLPDRLNDTIEHARPAGRQIHASPGCQAQTSSRHTTPTRSSDVAASRLRVRSTAGAWRECQLASSVLPVAAASAARFSPAPSVAPGGFPRSTFLPRSSATSAAR